MSAAECSGLQPGEGLQLIYLDNHATTPIDPAVLDLMVRFQQKHFANSASVTHAAGREVAELVESALQQIATGVGARSDEIVITSGATESNNLALFGYCLQPRQKRRKVVSLVSEHRAMLDPLKRLERQGFEVVLLPVKDRLADVPGEVDLERVESAIDEETALVSVMLANNEIGVLQPLRAIASMCQRFGAILHSDASQAVGRIPVNVDELGVDLMSFSAHKFYGPKGVGGLFVRRHERPVRLQAQVVGGGQQHNLRSGTLNSPGVMGLGAAMSLSEELLHEEPKRLDSLRDRLYAGLKKIEGVELNGPRLDDAVRLPGNLNCSFMPFEGQSLMLAIPELCVSSGSACTSAEPEPSHVLAAIGLSPDESRSSLRFGVGRMNTEREIDAAVELVAGAAEKLRKMI